MWHHYNATTYRIFESGSYKTNYTGQPTGQKMRVSREKDGANDYIRYYLGGVLKRTVPDPSPTAPMYADISIYRTNTAVCDLKIGKLQTIKTDTVRYSVKNGSTFTMNEHHLYGSSRLGMEQKNEFLAFSGDNVMIDSLRTTVYTDNDSTISTTFISSSINTEDTTFTEPDSIWIKNLGWKKYELSNHLGNVMTVISDRKLGIDSTENDTADYYLVDVVSASDYYPFGKEMPGRQYSPNSYRFSFNGKEDDTEWGNGLQDYGFRIYSKDLGRFLSVDPLFKGYPWYTPYQFAGNMPIWAIDLDGLEELIVIRWFDGDIYKGETRFRVENSRQREQNHRNGNDMQLIELDISKKQQFLNNLDSRNIQNVSNDIKNDDGSFKGEYVQTVPLKYSTSLNSLRTSQAPNRNSYIDPIASTETIMFNYDSDNFKFEISGEALDLMKRRLSLDPERTIYIDGYSSLENETNDPDYNVKLSQKRADAVKNYLIENGISADRIQFSEGKGGTDEFNNSDTDEGKAENRRVIVTYSYEKKQ